MKTLMTTALFLSLLFVSKIAFAIPVLDVWINEFHYDNTSTDNGEFIELAGTAGLDLSGYSISLYNGYASQLNVYKTISLSGQLLDTANGFGFSILEVLGLQNGGADPDGFALIDPSNSVLQFLSYEGSFTATDGPAKDLLSIDIGVFESSSTAVGYSLQLTGNGTSYNDFFWAAPQLATKGFANKGQSFTSTTSVPEPSPFVLMTIGMLAFNFSRRKLKH